MSEKEVHILSKIEGLGGLLKRIGNFDPSTYESCFNDRLILQKTVYLMQEFDLHIGYFYNWYIRGPYSPALTRDTYKLVDKFQSLPPARFVDVEAENRFKQFLVFIKPKARDHSWLEKIASIQFLSKMYPSMSREEIFFRTKAKVPNLTRSDFENMCQELTRFGLLKGEN